MKIGKKNRKSKEEYYREGMTDGVEPVGKKLDEIKKDFDTKVEAVQENLKMTVKKPIDEISNYIASQEKEKDYGISCKNNYKDLEPDDKEYLINLLYLFLKKEDSPDELQKKYFLAIQNFLNIPFKDLQDDCDVSKIKNIDSIKAQTAILTTTLEFFFLKNPSSQHWENNNYNDFYENFNIKNNDLKNIQNRIVTLYEKLGPEAIIKQYDCNIDDLQKEEPNIPASEDNCSPKDTIEETEIHDITDIFISTILHVNPDEKKAFSNNNIHINSFINCEGILEFNNCTINYNESTDKNQIHLDSNSVITFTNCTILSHSFNEDVFMTGLRSNVLFENCTFENCSNFLYIEEAKFILKNCLLTNCFGDFITLEAAEGEISDCLITEAKTKSDRPTTLFKIDASSEMYIYNNTIIQYVYSNNFTYFNTRNKIKNCTFSGASKCIQDASTVEDCEFVNCKMVINTKFSDSAIIKDCYFEHCTNILLLGYSTTISYCQFMNCFDELIKTDIEFRGGVSIDFCEFINTVYLRYIGTSGIGSDLTDSSSISFSAYNGKNYKVNCITNCIFNGVAINDGFLIKVKPLEKLRSAALKVENCDFRNCTTKRESGSLIKTKIQYRSILKKGKEYVATTLKNCNGLDKVNKEMSSIEKVPRKSNNLAGESIGSNLSLISDTVQLGDTSSNNHSPAYHFIKKNGKFISV